MATRGQIILNFNNAMEQARQLNRCADDMRQQSKALETAASELKAGWEGEASGTYMGKCQTLQAKMTNSASNLDMIATAIERTARAYYEAEMNALKLAETRDS